MAIRRSDWFMLPNVIVDDMLPSLNGSSLKVLLVLIRKTHGWHRDAETVSLSQIGDICGLSKATCCEAIRDLCDKGLIVKVRNTSDDGGCAASTYEPNIEDPPPFGIPNGPVGQPNGAGRPAERYKEEIHQTEIHKPTLPIVPLEDSPVARADFTDFRRIWERLLGRLGRSLRKQAEELWARKALVMPVDSLEAALDRFSSWAKDQDEGLRNPLATFFKDPESWVPQGFVPQAGEMPAPPPPGGPGAPAPPLEDTQGPPPAVEAPAAPDSHWRDPWISMWNELVPSAPCVDWSPKHDDPLLAAASQDPDLQQRFREVCETAEQILAARRDAGEDASWLTIRWALKTKPGEPRANWWKILTTMKGFAKAKRPTASSAPGQATRDAIARLKQKITPGGNQG